MGSRRSVSLVLVLLMLALLTVSQAAQAFTAYKRLSVASTSGNLGGGMPADVTPGGRFAVFVSDRKLTGEDYTCDVSSCNQIYVRDRDTDNDSIFDEPSDSATILVSVNTAGDPAAQYGATSPSISDDGRFVAFDSSANNLTPGDNFATRDIFVHDRDTDDDGTFDEAGQTASWRVSNGTLGPYGESFPGISGNGRYIAYGQQVSDGFGNPLGMNLWVSNLDVDGDGILQEASDQSWTQLTNSPSFNLAQPSVSSTGRFIAYDQFDKVNLLDRSSDGDATFDEPGDITSAVVSKTTSGDPATGSGAQLDSSGGHVVFTSSASNIVLNDTNGMPDAFVYNRLTDSTARVSLMSDGGQSDERVHDVGISPDGATVAFGTSGPFIGDPEELHIVDVATGTLNDRGPLNPRPIFLSNSEVVFGSYRPLGEGDYNEAFDAYATPIGANFSIAAFDWWDRIVPDFLPWRDVSFETMARDASSCGPDPRLSNPMTVEGVTLNAPSCVVTEYDIDARDNLLLLEPDATISFPAGVTAVTVLPASIDAAHAYYTVEVTDGNGDPITLTAQRHSGGYGPRPLALSSSAGIAEIKVVSSVEVPIGSSTATNVPLPIAHILASPASAMPTADPDIDTYTDQTAFDSDFPTSTTVDVAGAPDGASDECVDTEPVITSPYLLDGLVLTHPVCLRIRNGLLFAEPGMTMDLPAGTGGVLLTANASGTGIVQAERPDGTTITKTFEAGGGENVKFGFGSISGISRLRFLAASAGGPIVVSGVELAPLPPPPPESVSNTVAAGGSLSTGATASAADPVETTVTLPASGSGGTVSINEGTITETPDAGYTLLGQQINISAPDASLADPNVLTFRLDSSLVPAGEDESTVTILKFGNPAADCPGATQIPAGSDPCIKTRTLLSDGDIELVVLTSTTSPWNFGVADTTDPVVLMTPFTRAQYLTKTLVPEWSGLDAEGGPVTFTVQKREAAFNGNFSSFSNWKTTSATSASLSATAGTTYCFRVRATDSAANQSAYSSERCAATPLDDRGLSVLSGSWARKTGSSFYRSTATQASGKGATIQVKGVKARSLTLVASRCSTCGTVAVIWNGATIKTLSLKGSTANKVEYFIKKFGSVATGTLKLKITTSGKLVKIDGLEVTKF